MSTNELFTIDHSSLQFPFELNKHLSCSLYLTNKTDNHVAFKVKTTHLKNYCVRPNSGVVLPRSTCEVIVTMQAQKEAPSDMQSNDKFMIQSVIASPGVKEVTREMFNKEAGLVLLFALPRPTSSVHQGSKEASSPRPFVIFITSNILSDVFSCYGVRAACHRARNSNL